MPSHTNVVMALLGASAGIAGLTLVFLGLIIAAVRSYRPGTAAEVLRPLRTSAGLVMVAFASSIATVTLGAAWLISLRDPGGLYAAFVVLFFVQLVLLCVVVGQVARQIVWGS